jgi:hypothetical protein
MPLVIVAVSGACQDPPPDGSECVTAPGRGTCIGVGTEAFVASGFHTAGATCGTVWHVQEGATGGTGTDAAPFGDLAAAAAVAGPGDCLALAAGQYAAVPLSGSVSLLGAGAGVTEIAAEPAGLWLQGGGGAVIRGVEVTGDGSGLVVREVEQVRIEDVRVTGGIGVGITVRDATDVAVVRTHVTSVALDAGEAAVVGVFADRAPGLRVEASLVEDVPGPGIVVYRSDGAELRDCVARDLASYGVAVDGEPGLPSTRAVLDGVGVARVQGVGIWLRYLRADLTHLSVEDVAWSTSFARGVEINRSEIQAQAVAVSRGDDLGMFLVRTTGGLADVTVQDTAGIGVRAQFLFQGELPSVILERLVVERASNTALMISGPVDLDLSASRLSRTVKSAVLIEDAGCTIADGLAVYDGASVDVFDVAFEAMPRHAAVLDGAGDFFFTGCSFDAEEEPAVVQNVAGYDAAASFVGNSDPAGAIVVGVEPAEPVCSMASGHVPL